jgi:hypothetical protein
MNKEAYHLSDDEVRMIVDALRMHTTQLATAANNCALSTFAFEQLHAAAEKRSVLADKLYYEIRDVTRAAEAVS